jgi:predicted O-methyltransferase YrrM
MSMLSAPDILAQPRGEAVRVDGRQCHHRVVALRQLAQACSAETYLEIGVHNGTSMSYAASAPSVRLCVGIDLFEDTRGHYVRDRITTTRTQANVERNKNPNCVVTLLKGDSRAQETVRRAGEMLGGSKVDILFIDGDHSYQGARGDYAAYRHLVRNGGFVVFDDYSSVLHPGVVCAADQCAAAPGNRRVGVLYGNELVIQVGCADPSQHSTGHTAAQHRPCPKAAPRVPQPAAPRSRAPGLWRRRHPPPRRRRPL